MKKAFGHEYSSTCDGGGDALCLGRPVPDPQTCCRAVLPMANLCPRRHRVPLTAAQVTGGPAHAAPCQRRGEQAAVGAGAAAAGSAAEGHVSQTSTAVFYFTQRKTWRFGAVSWVWSHPTELLSPLPAVWLLRAAWAGVAAGTALARRQPPRRQPPPPSGWWPRASASRLWFLGCST